MQVSALLLFLLFALPQGHRANRHINTDPDEEGLPHQTLSGDVTANKKGEVFIPFIPMFKYDPTCSYSGDTLPGEQPKQTAEGAVLKVKRFGIIHYECRGVSKASGPKSRGKDRK